MDPDGTDEDYYRYEVLRDCNLEWLDRVCALDIHDEARGNDKCVTIAYSRHFKKYILLFLDHFSRMTVVIGIM